MRELLTRLTQIRHDLKEIVPFTIAYIEALIGKYRNQFPRRTEITSFEKVDVREAAKRDQKLCYDKATGYLGHQVDGTHIADVSLYDRVLVVRKDGSYSVVDAPDKLFIGKGMLFCGFPDKEQTFNVVFRDKKGATKIKRCKIEGFILNRAYELVPDDGVLLKFTVDNDAILQLEYKPAPRLRVLEEQFAIGDYPIQGVKANGVQLSKKVVKSVRMA